MSLQTGLKLQKDKQVHQKSVCVTEDLIITRVGVEGKKIQTGLETISQHR